jgi:acyl-CoA thioesterase-1
MNRLHHINTKSLLISLFCLLIAMPSWGQANRQVNNSVILVLGDSLSAEYGLPRGAGWVKLLEQKLHQAQSPWSVFNASISGETTSGGLARLPLLLDQKKPGIVMLELGANDALRGLPIEETEANLRKMIIASKRTGAKVLLFGMRIPPNYGQKYTTQFAALYSSLAKEESVALVPFFLTDVATRPELFQADRIHPNSEAQPILFNSVWAAMIPFYSLLKVDRK